MGAPSTSYEPRSPARQILHQIVRDHVETFRAEAARLRNGDGLPGFVERECREFLQCGALAAGFARFQCRACRHDRLVAFSCKGRGFCPSCGGRSGAVLIIQRFGGALNLNVHSHALVLDGVFAPDTGGRLQFHRTPRLTTDEVAAVLHLMTHRVGRLLERRGLGAEDSTAQGLDPWVDESPALAGLSAAAVQGVTACGARAGSRPHRWGDPLDARIEAMRGRCHARERGFDLHAGLVVRQGQSDRLERLCRYVLRPPLTQDRLRLTPDGQIALQLRQRWRDGTTHLVFAPTAFLERLAALTPRPRINLILYDGVLAPRAAWRDLVVGWAPAGRSRAGTDRADAAAGDTRGARWAALMQRSFGFDVLACPRCGGRLRVIARITQPSIIARILSHLGRPTERPATRAPPPLAEPDLPDFES